MGLAKPNPRLFRLVLERLEVEAEAAMHVGDHPLEDVEGAQAAGMEAVLLDRGRPAGASSGSTPAGARDLLEVAAALERRLGRAGARGK